MISKVPPPVPIPQPPMPPPGLAADVVVSGPSVHPEDRVRLFSSGEWERFVQEWVDSLRDDYELVERCGGAGDMGRDVIAMVKGGNGAWDNYQCKHYQKALAPGDVWVELGKLAYYTLRGDYSYPRLYFFVAPQGVGPTLSNLLKQPHALRDGLLANWDKACRTEITKTEVVDLLGTTFSWSDLPNFLDRGMPSPRPSRLPVDQKSSVILASACASGFQGERSSRESR